MSPSSLPARQQHRNAEEAEQQRLADLAAGVHHPHLSTTAQRPNRPYAYCPTCRTSGPTRDNEETARRDQQRHIDTKGDWPAVPQPL